MKKMVVLMLTILLHFYSQSKECCNKENNIVTIDDSSSLKIFDKLMQKDILADLNKFNIEEYISANKIRFLRYEFIKIAHKNLRGVAYYLTENLTISFLINKFKGISTFNPDGDWDIKKVEKEIFSKVIISYNLQCIKCYQ